MQAATNEFDRPQSNATGKGLSVVLWILQILLAALFLFSGVMKFVMPLAEMTKQSHLPGPFLYFIGIAEIVGGIGLVVPAITRMQPLLTPLAAVGLVIIMIGATILSLPMGLFAAFPLVIGLLTAFVGYGRFRLRPITPKRA